MRLEEMKSHIQWGKKREKDGATQLPFLSWVYVGTDG